MAAAVAVVRWQLLQLLLVVVVVGIATATIDTATFLCCHDVRILKYRGSDRDMPTWIAMCFSNPAIAVGTSSTDFSRL